MKARFLVERHGELVDHLVAAAIFDSGFDKFRLVPVHVVLRQDPAHRLQSVFDLLGVVCGAVLPKQVLEHISGHHCVLLELCGEVLAHHQAREVLKDLLIQGAFRRGGAGGHGLSEIVEVVTEGLEQLHVLSFEANRRLYTLQHLIDSELEQLVVVVAGGIGELQVNQLLPFSRFHGGGIQSHREWLTKQLLLVGLGNNIDSQGDGEEAFGFTGFVLEQAELQARGGDLVGHPQELRLHFSAFVFALLF